MIYLELHLGDWSKTTAHLSAVEEATLLRLVLWYASEERPLPLDEKRIARIARAESRAERDAVRLVLREFFTETPDGFRRAACDHEIARVHAKSEKARASAMQRGGARRSDVAPEAQAPDSATAPPSERSANATPNAPANDERTSSEPGSESAALRTPDSGLRSPEEEGRVLTLLPVPTVVERERSTAADVERVFLHWQTEHRHPLAKLDTKRRGVIARALRTYSAEELCRSITGYRSSPHHMGQNDRGTVYDSIELFLRDAQHIDAGLKLATEGTTHAPVSRFTRGQSQLDRLIAEAEREEPSLLENDGRDLRAALVR